MSDQRGVKNRSNYGSRNIEFASEFNWNAQA
jgi:hypothetical protein